MLFKTIGNVCQNCIKGNNGKGKWTQRRFRYNHPGGYWYVFCEKKHKYFPWDRHKHCFEKDE